VSVHLEGGELLILLTQVLSERVLLLLEAPFKGVVGVDGPAFHSSLLLEVVKSVENLVPDAINS